MGSRRGWRGHQVVTKKALISKFAALQKWDLVHYEALVVFHDLCEQFIQIQERQLVPLLDLANSILDKMIGELDFKISQDSSD